MAGAAQDQNGGDVAALGRSVFTTYLFPFEITAALLVIAVVGAVVLARRPERPGRPTTTTAGTTAATTTGRRRRSTVEGRGGTGVESTEAVAGAVAESGVGRPGAGREGSDGETENEEGPR